MSRDLNRIGNKDGSSSFLNVDNISEINHKLKKESDILMMMMMMNEHTPRMMSYIGNPSKDICIKANVTLGDIHATLDQDLFL